MRNKHFVLRNVYLNKTGNMIAYMKGIDSYEDSGIEVFLLVKKYNFALAEDIRPVIKYLKLGEYYHININDPWIGEDSWKYKGK